MRRSSPATGARGPGLRTPTPPADPSAVVIRPGYLDGHWTKASWSDQGVRDKVGATHWPLPDLLHAFIDASLMPERLAEGGEGGEPTPVVLALRARKHQ
jgi:hypothetical protein